MGKIFLGLSNGKQAKTRMADRTFECEKAAETRIHTDSRDIDFWGMASARQTVDGKLDLYSEEQRVKKILWERKQNEREQPRHKKPMDRGYER